MNSFGRDVTFDTANIFLSLMMQCRAQNMQFYVFEKICWKSEISPFISSKDEVKNSVCISLSQIFSFHFSQIEKFIF